MTGSSPLSQALRAFLSATLLWCPPQKECLQVFVDLGTVLNFTDTTLAACCPGPTVPLSAIDSHYLALREITQETERLG